MTPNVRIYGSEEAAQNAAAKLVEAGFGEQRVLLASGHAGKEEAAVQSAAEDGFVPEHHVEACVRSLQQGRSLVAVKAHFGRAVTAIKVMEASGAVDSDALPAYVSPRDPSPLSDLVGIPVLAQFTPATELTSSSWSLSSLFGMPLLSRNPAPLSSMFGLPTLSGSGTGQTSSFGMPLLSNNPAPLSSLFGMKLLTKDKRPWDTSFGFGLLSNNPAPLSSLFGMRTLSKDE